jgi:hypothetical protein
VETAPVGPDGMEMPDMPDMEDLVLESGGADGGRWRHIAEDASRTVTARGALAIPGRPTRDDDRVTVR